jgi:hypothetical protein
MLYRGTRISAAQQPLAIKAIFHYSGKRLQVQRKFFAASYLECENTENCDRTRTPNERSIHVLDEHELTIDKPKQLATLHVNRLFRNSCLSVEIVVYQKFLLISSFLMMHAQNSYFLPGFN